MNSASVLPAGTLTKLGTEAIVAWSETNVILTPAAGATTGIVTFPLTVVADPPFTLVGESEKAVGGFGPDVTRENA